MDKRKYIKKSYLNLFIRLLSKLATADEMQGNFRAQNHSVVNLREDSSTKLTQQFASVVEFRKKSIVILSFFVMINTAYSGAWTAGAGEYKYSASNMFLDKTSFKRKKLRQQESKELDLLAYMLDTRKQKIITEHIAAKGHKEDLSNSDKAKIAAIDQDLQMIKDRKSKLRRPEDHSFSKLEIEYGVKDKNSIGTIITYNLDKFNYKYNSATSAEIYFKHQLWQKNDYVISIEPRFSALNFNQYYNKSLLGGSLLLGKSNCRNNTKYCNFREVGIYAARTVNKTIYGAKHIKLTFQEGFKFPYELSVLNFMELEYIKTNREYGELNYFEQISVAKTFDIANLGSNDLTLQLGYFWKGSLKGDFDTISGPVISLWLTI